MGTWGVNAFDNDAANDWAYDLEDVADLSLVVSALTDVEAVGGEYLDEDVACSALAACEVIARLRGRTGYTDAYTEKVDAWVAAHRLQPEPGLVGRAQAAIDRILAADSELAELWAGSDDGEQWRMWVADLRRRVAD